VRDNPIPEERPHLRLGTVTNGENLERGLELIRGKRFRRGTDLAVLHHISLPQPSLVERFTRGMDDMTQAILFGQHEHGVKQTFHRAGRLDQSGAKGGPERGIGTPVTE